MKKILSAIAIIISTSIVSNAQFTDKGYKDINLDMTLGQVEKIIKSEIKESVTTIRYNNVDLKLEFGIIDPKKPKGYKLYSISTDSKNAEFANVSVPLIGKHRTEVKKILGEKYKFPESDDAYYHLVKEFNPNEAIYLIFEFDEKGILNKISILKP